MRILAVYCHPLAGSYCAALRDRALQALRDGGHEVELLDLYAEGFDPVLSPQERSTYLADTAANLTAVQRHVDLLRWAEGLLAARGVELAGGRIRLLTQPRMLGWVFNPVSFWYCEHADGRLRAVIAEVNNTFGERHSYVLTAAEAGTGASAGAALPYDCALDKDKCFHVSPLLDLEGRYHFRFAEPGDRLQVRLDETRRGAPLIDTAMAGERRAMTDRTLLVQLLRMPVQAFKVLAAIHWQALKIWLRGGRFHGKPPPPDLEAT